MTTGDSAGVQQTELDPAHELISSRRIEGTAVYNRQHERLGTVHSVLLEKKSGNTAYALLSFGGFLGLGKQVHPIPWAMLDYDVERHGYVIDLTREQLESAPTMGLDEADRPRDRAYDEQLAQYYNAAPWW